MKGLGREHGVLLKTREGHTQKHSKDEELPRYRVAGEPHTMSWSGNGLCSGYNVEAEHEERIIMW